MRINYSVKDRICMLKWKLDENKYDRRYRAQLNKIKRQQAREQEAAEKLNTEKNELVVVDADGVNTDDGTVIRIAIGDTEDPEHPFIGDHELMALMSRVGDRMEKKGVGRHVSGTIAAVILGITHTISMTQLIKAIESYKNVSECKLIANSVCSLYTKVKLFGDENVYNIREVISVDNLVDIVNYLLHVRQWNYSETMRMILDITTKTLNDERYKNTNEDRAMAPFIFSSIRTGSLDGMTLDGTIYPAPARMSAINLTNLRNVFGNLLDKYPSHAFDVVRSPYDPTYVHQGICRLFINNMYFEIDLGTVGANGFSMIIPFTRASDGITEFLFCNISRHRDIVERYIDACIDRSLQMDEEFVKQMIIDVDTMRNEMFTNPNIYAMFDFSGMSKIVRKMTTEQRKRFEENLTHVFNMPWNWTTVALTRYRFNDYVSPDEFTLVHDEDVVTPYPWMIGGAPHQNQVVINFKRTEHGGIKTKILANGEPVNL